MVKNPLFIAEDGQGNVFQGMWYDANDTSTVICIDNEGNFVYKNVKELKVTNPKPVQNETAAEDKKRKSEVENFAKGTRKGTRK